MKTTIYLDDDLFDDLKAQAQASGQTFRSVLNQALRRGIASPPKRKRTNYRCPSFPMGEPRTGVNLDKALALTTDLEDDSVLRKIEMQK